MTQHWVVVLALLLAYEILADRRGDAGCPLIAAAVLPSASIAFAWGLGLGGGTDLAADRPGHLHCSGSGRSKNPAIGRVRYARGPIQGDGSGATGELVGWLYGRCLVNQVFICHTG